MWKLNLYKLTFGVILFSYLLNEILGGVAVSSETSPHEVESGGPSADKSKHSQSKKHNPSHNRHSHHHSVQQIEVNATVKQPKVSVSQQFISEHISASPGFTSSDSPLNNLTNDFDSSSSFKSDHSVSSESQKTLSSGFDVPASFKSDDHYFGKNISNESTSETPIEPISSIEKPGLVEPGSSSGDVADFSSSTDSPELSSTPEPTDSSVPTNSSVINNSTSNSSGASSRPQSSPLISFISWLFHLIRKIFT